MDGPSRAVQPPGDDAFHFRSRTPEEMTNLHREGQRLIDQAQAVKEQWLASRLRMRGLWDAIENRRVEREDPAVAALDRLLQRERAAHAASKLALEREVVRGRRLEDEVLAVQDQERERLARDLHDGVCQSLAGLTFLLEMHLQQLQELAPDSRPLRTGRQLQDMLAHAFQEMRGLSHGLSGIETGDRGENLCPALHALAGRLEAAGVVRCVAVCPDPPALGGANATHLYRLVQEAVSNALRHGQAGHVEIRLVRDGGGWRLTVTDDGVGVPAAGTPDTGGLGLRSMLYRAAVIGGTLEVRRGSGAGERPGTVVCCTFP